MQTDMLRACNRLTLLCFALCFAVPPLAFLLQHRLLCVLDSGSNAPCSSGQGRDDFAARTHLYILLRAVVVAVDAVEVSFSVTPLGALVRPSPGVRERGQ